MCLTSINLVVQEEGGGADWAFLFLPDLFGEEEEREKDSIEEKDEFQVREGGREKEKEKGKKKQF